MQIRKDEIEMVEGMAKVAKLVSYKMSVKPDPEPATKLSLRLDKVKFQIGKNKTEEEINELSLPENVALANELQKEKEKLETYAKSAAEYTQMLNEFFKSLPDDPVKASTLLHYCSLRLFNECKTINDTLPYNENSYKQQRCSLFENTLRDFIQNRIKSCDKKNIDKEIKYWLDISDKQNSYRDAQTFRSMVGALESTKIDNPELNKRYHTLIGGYELSLITIKSFDKLNQEKLEKKPSLLQDKDGHCKLWGFHNKEWQLTEVSEDERKIYKIPLWEGKDSLLVSPSNPIYFGLLQKSHTLTDDQPTNVQLLSNNANLIEKAKPVPPSCLIFSSKVEFTVGGKKKELTKTIDLIEKLQEHVREKFVDEDLLGEILNKLKETNKQEIAINVVSTYVTNNCADISTNLMKKHSINQKDADKMVSDCITAMRRLALDSPKNAPDLTNITVLGYIEIAKAGAKNLITHLGNSLEAMNKDVAMYQKESSDSARTLFQQNGESTALSLLHEASTIPDTGNRNKVLDLYQQQQDQKIREKIHVWKDFQGEVSPNSSVDQLIGEPNEEKPKGTFSIPSQRNSSLSKPIGSRSASNTPEINLSIGSSRQEQDEAFDPVNCQVSKLYAQLDKLIDAIKKDASNIANYDQFRDLAETMCDQRREEIDDRLKGPLDACIAIVEQDEYQYLEKVFTTIKDITSEIRVNHDQLADNTTLPNQPYSRLANEGNRKTFGSFGSSSKQPRQPPTVRIGEKKGSFSEASIDSLSETETNTDRTRSASRADSNPPRMELERRQNRKITLTVSQISKGLLNEHDSVSNERKESKDTPSTTAKILTLTSASASSMPGLPPMSSNDQPAIPLSNSRRRPPTNFLGRSRERVGSEAKQDPSFSITNNEELISTSGPANSNPKK